MLLYFYIGGKFLCLDIILVISLLLLSVATNCCREVIRRRKEKKISKTCFILDSIRLSYAGEPSSHIADLFLRIHYLNVLSALMTLLFKVFLLLLLFCI
jgi:hypothetical protein